MSKLIRGTVLSGVLAGLLLAPAMAAAQDEESQADARIEISGTSSQETHHCSPKTEVEITGSENDVTLTGECKSVNVTGASNKVKVEAVATITVTGADNSVTWKRAVGGKKPKVSRSGANNKVTQAR